MLRIGHTYELAISQLWLKTEEGRTRPAIATAPLFRGHQGTLAVDLWNPENKSLRGSIAPVFYTAAGEVLDLLIALMKQFARSPARLPAWDASIRTSPWLRPRTKAVSHEVRNRSWRARLEAA